MRKITELQKNDKPREKLATKGVEALNSKKLLMVILGKGIKGRDATVLATDILKLIEKERDNLTLEKLEKVPGDFMFELTDAEIDSLVSQPVIPSKKYFSNGE